MPSIHKVYRDSALFSLNFAFFGAESRAENRAGTLMDTGSACTRITSSTRLFAD